MKYHNMVIVRLLSPSHKTTPLTRRHNLRKKNNIYIIIIQLASVHFNEYSKENNRNHNEEVIKFALISVVYNIFFFPFVFSTFPFLKKISSEI